MRISLPSILTADTIEPPWIVENMITQGSLVILAGSAGVGKSVLSYHLALCAALGTPFLGHKCPPTRVLYYDQENAHHDFGAYLAWAWHSLGTPDIAGLEEQFILESRTLGHKDWLSVMTTHAEELKPGLIVIDTASSALAVQDENDNAEAVRVINALYRVQQSSGPGCTILILKHQLDAKDTRKIRGAKAWVSATDQTLFHLKNVGRPGSKGLFPTRLIPDKSRAWGLKEGIKIFPSWTPDGKGLILTGTPLIAPTP